MLKFLTVLVATLVLGGCTLQNYFSQGGNAVRDEASLAPVASLTPSSSPEASLGTGTDDTSLETDLNSTVIESEDFSDLN